MYSILAIALTSLLALTPSALAAPAPREQALEFTMALPEYFCANSVQTLFWRGGSGSYDVKARLHYSGYDDADDKITDVVASSTEKRKDFNIGRIGSEFPAGSTYTFVLVDAGQNGEPVLTAPISIYNC